MRALSQTNQYALSVGKVSSMGTVAIMSTVSEEPIDGKVRFPLWVL
jgi:hypothetical protein